MVTKTNAAASADRKHNGVTKVYSQFGNYSLANAQYPLGHGTGLDAKGWFKFATEEYPVGKFDKMRPSHER